jgi:hypothetical protein
MRLLQISDKGAVREPDYSNRNGYVEAFFQLDGMDAAERPVLRRKLRRNQALAFFAKLPPTVIGMEACGAAHYWARIPDSLAMLAIRND